MALTDLLKSFVRASAFGAALYTCGGGTETVYPCRTTADCTSGTCVRGYCEGGNGGDSNSTYTCESGSRMIKDECCDLFKCQPDIYEEFLEECNEEIRRGNNLQQFFECVYDVCHNRREPVKDRVNDCEEQVWP